MRRSFGIDLTPLRASKQYRRLYVAGFVTSLGAQATYVTMPFQLRQLTHSTLQVGALGLAELVPLVICGLYGGVLADRLNRRTLIITMEVGLLLVTGLVLVNALLAHPSVWVLYLVAFLAAAIGSLQRPSIEALNQTYVPHDLQRAAAALANIRYTMASIVGPAAGGLLAVALGVQFVYAINVVTFCASLVLLLRLDRQVAQVSTAENDRAALREGVTFLRERPDIVGTYVVDMLAMVLAYPMAMLPFVAARFHETFALSLLYLGMPVGALVATLLSKWTRRIHHYGRAVIASAAAWGLGIALFGVTSSLVLVLVGLAIAGGADSYSGIFRSTMWNESIRPDMRGRTAGTEMISYSLGPTAGQFRAGVMAAWTTLRFSLTVGGLACTGAVGVVALALPSLWRFDARTDEHVREVRELRANEVFDSME